jgi:predicted dehydrogenase
MQSGSIGMQTPSPARPTRFAIVGCGFVADYYLSTLPNHPGLQLAGVLDQDDRRAQRFAKYWGAGRIHRSLEELLGDAQVEIVLNLTNPGSHYAVTRACLLAGKHVYSEKPLALEFTQSEELVRLAEQRGLYLSGAPCTVLGEAAQTMWKVLRDGTLGTVRLAHAEMDDGMKHQMEYHKWTSPSGLPWPYKDEFETGCTIEHAGYQVTWLTAFFGPARRVTAFASCQIPDKQTPLPLDRNAPDVSVACIEFASGVVARVSASVVAPHNHRLAIFGDAGNLSCKDSWKFGSPVYLQKPGKWRAAMTKRSRIFAAISGRVRFRHPLLRRPLFKSYAPNTHHIDFCRGVAELAEAIRDRRPCRLSARYVLHVNEIILTMQNPAGMGSPRVLTSSFEPMEPMPWAQLV